MMLTTSFVVFLVMFMAYNEPTEAKCDCKAWCEFTCLVYPKTWDSCKAACVAQSNLHDPLGTGEVKCFGECI